LKGFVMTKEQFVAMAKASKSKVEEILITEGDGESARLKIALEITDPIYYLLTDENFVCFSDPNTLSWHILINDIYLQLMMDINNNGVERVERCCDKTGNEYWFDVKMNSFEEFYEYKQSQKWEDLNQLLCSSIILIIFSFIVSFLYN
jgi:hypothetical protein